MILGTACLAERALDGEAILGALRACSLDRVLLVASRDATPSGLMELPAVAVRARFDDVELAVATARASRARRLVLDLGERLDVEAACRRLFAQARAHPGLLLSVITPASGPLATPQALALVLDDLGSVSVGYWHRPARAHLQGGGDEPWIDTLGRRLVGMSLDDVSGSETGLPPGVGEIDFERVADLCGRSLDVALDLDPIPEVGLLRFALGTLQRAGFP